MAAKVAPSRSDLEGLSTSALQSLIADAAAVLAARADARAKSDTDAKLPAFQPADRLATADAATSPAVLQGGSLFTFGVETSSAPQGASSSSGLFSAKPGGLFASTGGGLFGAPASSGSPGSLFGGSGGGLFGGSSGGSLFGGTAPPPLGNDEAAKEGEDGEYVKEEEVTEVQGWKPSVSLEVQASIETGEEGEEQVYSQRSKLYRWRDGEWKERGLGEARLLRNSQGQVRFLLRQEKTGKVVANHQLVNTPPYCDLRPNADNEKIWVWTTPDSSEDSLETQQFALKFGSVELAFVFKEAFNAAKQGNLKATLAEEKKG